MDVASVKAIQTCNDECKISDDMANLEIGNSNTQLGNLLPSQIENQNPVRRPFSITRVVFHSAAQPLSQAIPMINYYASARDYQSAASKAMSQSFRCPPENVLNREISRTLSPDIKKVVRRRHIPVFLC